MPNARRETTRSATSARTDVLNMLKDDHKKAKKAFQEFERLDKRRQSDDCQALAMQTCGELALHTTLEEELFYPAAREVLGEDEDLVDEADVEHATAKDLIAQLEAMSPGDALYDAKVKVLGEYIDHHVKEEEGEMFPKAKKGKLDSAAIGLEMADRKAELLSQLGVEV